MRKLLLLVLLFLAIPVHAKEYELKTLIETQDVATVHTEKFDYVDFTYSSEGDGKNGVINFTSIHNRNTVTQTPISINVLLFDKDKKNIGYLTYCTDKDYSTSYSYYKLKGDQSIPFKITVSSKYFVEGYSAKDVSYIAVYDDNQFCQIGGYTKFAGQTIEQIRGEEKVKEEKGRFSLPSFDYDKILSFFKNKVFKKILIGVGVFVVYLVFSSLLNTLYQRMSTRKNILSFIPIIHIFIAVKLVFGNIIAILYSVLLAASIAVFFLLKIKIPLYVMLILLGICILLIIIKLITKKYDLFYIEPKMDSSKYIQEEVKPQEESLLDEVSEPIDLGANKGNKDQEVSNIDSILKSLENPDDNH